MENELDWKRLLSEQEWLQQTDLPMIVSPDFDGLLCALLMSHYRNWRLCGFYDGRKLTLAMPPTHIRESGHGNLPTICPQYRQSFAAMESEDFTSRLYPRRQP